MFLVLPDELWWEIKPVNLCSVSLAGAHRERCDGSGGSDSRESEVTCVFLWLTELCFVCLSPQHLACFIMFVSVNEDLKAYFPVCTSGSDVPMEPVKPWS